MLNTDEALSGEACHTSYRPKRFSGEDEYPSLVRGPFESSIGLPTTTILPNYHNFNPRLPASLVPMLYKKNTVVQQRNSVGKANHSCPNPIVSSTAIVNFICNASSDLYGGRSSRLKLPQISTCKMVSQKRVAYHVCDFGRLLSSPAFSIVNLLGPSLPWRSLKPFTGIREVPVAN